MPLEAINAEAAREKSIRHGHPSTLHLWWARRPLAACRAVLFGQFVDDPSSVPEEFPTEAEQENERERLHALIAELAKWESSTNEKVLNAARREIARSIARWRLDLGEAEEFDQVMLRGTPLSCDVNDYLAEKSPPVYDPFCGGGSIPLEAQRLGFRALGSDLNPVAVLITKAMVEIPSRFKGLQPVNPESQSSVTLSRWSGAMGLAEDVRYYGAWMRQEAEKHLVHLYPKVKITREMAHTREDLRRYEGRELSVIAWLWARTVKCPNPICQVNAPLVRSFWLSRKPGRAAWIEPHATGKKITFTIRRGKGGPVEGTVGKAGAHCLQCEHSITLDYIRAEAKEGRMHQQLMAIAVEGNRERLYIEPHSEYERGSRVAEPINVPATSLPAKALGFRVQAYGMRKHRDLFTSRQLATMTTLADLVSVAMAKVQHDAVGAGLSGNGTPLDQGGSGAIAYAEAIATFLAMAVARYSNGCTSLCSWNPGAKKEDIRLTFSRHALAMIWDFAEGNPFSHSSGNFADCTELWLYKAIRALPAMGMGHVFQKDAASKHAEKLSAVTATDPPYYDNIGYADLSDLFYIWLRRSLSEVYPDLFATLLTPKDGELIASPHRERANEKAPEEFFEDGLRASFETVVQTQAPQLPVTVYYAFKQEESDDESVSTSSTGWDTMLSGLLRAGLSVNATWPVRTERGGRPIGIGTNALASSIVLACRLRPTDAPVTTRSEFVTALRHDLPGAVKRLQEASIAPVDLAQSAIGPGMAIFSRYSKVLEPDGSSMSVRTALGIINHLLDESLAAEEGDYDPDTRWAITWFTQYGFDPAIYGDAETLSKARNTSVQGLERAGIVEARAGKVRLLRRDELGAWHPTTDDRFTIWEACQHLIKTLETDGEAAAARLLKQLDSRADAARDLAYRLYQHCDRKGDAEEARAYNGLVVAWPRLAALAAEEPRPVAPTLDFT